MKFTSLVEMYKYSIQSFPEFTHLDLSANQIKLIKLVLYTRKGNSFYINHTAIADHLVIKKTDNRAKTVGNIIGQLKKKGFITTVQTFNYNGKNGGSSVTLMVDEVYLEQQLHIVFNTVKVLDQNRPQTLRVLDLEPVKMQLPNATPSDSTDGEFLLSNPETKEQTAADFAAELDAMEDEPRTIPDLPCLAKLDSLDEIEEDDKLEVEDFGYKEIETICDFKALLYHLLRLHGMWIPSVARYCT